MSKNLQSILDRPLARLIAVWALLDLSLAGSGVVTIVAAVCFRRPNQLIVNLILDEFHFFCTFLLTSGVAYFHIPFYPLPIHTVRHTSALQLARMLRSGIGSLAFQSRVVCHFGDQWRIDQDGANNRDAGSYGWSVARGCRQHRNDRRK